MTKNITRRDFLNGTQVAIGAALFSPTVSSAFGQSNPFALGAEYYPPGKTGLRGSHEGSWETMHARVRGRSWNATAPEEEFDLVIIGAGLSGLAAAHLYRKSRPNARILILDNHDDFGGHAKRNEFQIDGQTRIGYGGTESIDTPSAYSDVAKDLLVDLGVDTQKFYQAYDQELYSSMGLSKGILFDQETFGAQKLAVGYNKIPWPDFVAKTPLNEQAKKDLVRVWTEEKDYLPGLTSEQKHKKLAKVSYEAFLRDYVKVDPQLLEMYRRWGMSFWCVGIDEIPATQVQSYDGGMPGLDHTLIRAGHRGDEPYIFHFPDGNASLARLLVRSMIPGSVPGSTMEDVVLARADYSKLDRPGQNVRLRLNSTVVRAANTSDSKAVDVTFVHQKIAHTVRAARCIMAGYNGAIPYICPELPPAQKEALVQGVKAPLTYTKVLVPNWKPFAELGLDFVYYTNEFYKQVELDYPVSLGGYELARTPEEPMILHMCHVHHATDVQGPEQWNVARRKLLTTSFDTFEHHVRDQLDQALGSTGFDAGRDIHAITVNRWPHGYAYNPDLIWEPEYQSESDKPWVQGRKPIGRISIANSDAGAASNTKGAIDQAWRAVNEVLKD